MNGSYYFEGKQFFAEGYFADIVCSFCSTFGAPLIEAAFGEGTGPVWIDLDKCRGDEANFLECDRDKEGYDCGHEQDFSLVCIRKCGC